MGRRIFTEPGVNTALALETSVRSFGSVKDDAAESFMEDVCLFFANTLIKPCFLLF